MKSILYVAATLMIGASIYGFVDYKKTSRHKEFKTMYDETEVKKPVVTEEKTKPDIIKPETVSKEDLAVVTAEEQAARPVKKMKKKRTIDVESFSRAPLREREEITVPVKKESKVKEQ